ncbi:MAG: DUF808 domain-containing protein [Thermodesulfobacteriota bacterium]
MTGGLFAVLDDIATLLDDAAVMSKVAAKKTAGILGDDLAVNAEKATGFRASRELPVLWAITKGSLVNKVIIVPLALILSAVAPWLIVPILLLGGAYLSYEGVEKIYHTLTHKSHASHPIAETVSDEKEILKVEKTKVKSAIRTDFILSIEIVVIALGTVIDHPLATQVLVVSMIAILATVGVYGLVALIVRMDDAGFYLIKRAKEMQGAVRRMVAQMGSLLVASLPIVIRTLGIIGTIAMLMVGGGMYLHNIEAIHHALHFAPELLSSLLLGLVVGAVVLSAMLVTQKIRKSDPPESAATD